MYHRNSLFGPTNDYRIRMVLYIVYYISQIIVVSKHDLLRYVKPEIAPFNTLIYDSIMYIICIVRCDFRLYIRYDAIFQSYCFTLLLQTGGVYSLRFSQITIHVYFYVCIFLLKVINCAASNAGVKKIKSL